MKTFLALPLFLMTFSCKNGLVVENAPGKAPASASLTLVPKVAADTTSWAYFLQHLPEKDGPVLDYRGRPVEDQDKHVKVLPYDVGTKDLQQCADALMRLRAEYLFSQKRFEEISFRFTSGHAYRFADYCKGLLPVPVGNGISFRHSSTKKPDAASLRAYLDVVYTYAGTISLAAELKPATGFAIGTVVITPGSPGHCFIIVNEAVTPAGEKLFKLVEGYSPAQTIYVLRNVAEPSLGCWHRLQKGTISTASYDFTRYLLKTFE